MIIKWTNKHSKDTGYVKNISYKKRHFNNTNDISEAKEFTETNVNKAIKLLNDYGEGKNNEFEII